MQIAPAEFLAAHGVAPAQLRKLPKTERAALDTAYLFAHRKTMPDEFRTGLAQRLASVVTRFDRLNEERDAKRKIPANIYALGHYLGACKRIENDVCGSGHALETAIRKHTQDRLRIALLRGFGIKESTS